MITTAALHPFEPRADGAGVGTALDLELHQICERWAAWALSHYLIPEKLRRQRRRLPSDLMQPLLLGHELAALHLAINLQPKEALDRRVFEVYYLQRARAIKQVAAELGVSRSHFYRLLRDFRRRIAGVAQQLLKDPAARGAALPAYLHEVQRRHHARVRS